MMNSIKELFIPFRIKKFLNEQYKNNSPIIEFPLQSFRKQIKTLKVITDETIGGQSKGHINQLSDSGIYVQICKAQLNGYIKKPQRGELEQLPFVEFQYSLQRKLLVDDFSGIMLRVRTDGQIYKIRLLVRSMYYYGLQHIHAYITDQSQQFQYLELPFDNFIFYGEQKAIVFIESLSQTRLENHNASLLLSEISIMKESQNDLKFQLELQDIFLVKRLAQPEPIQNYEGPKFYRSHKKQLEFGLLNEDLNMRPQVLKNKSVNDMF
ncbi:hypothetical protein pb186bvf_001132 [Paramecium bursaria]